MLEFDERQSIAHLSDEELATYLDRIGDLEAARVLREARMRGQGIARMRGAPYAFSTHLFGFIEEGGASASLAPIVPATSINADQSLVGGRIKVTLDGFRVQEYPGLGEHTVLFDFQGRHQASGEKHDLQFASVLRVHDGDNAAVSGSPIFTGLVVPQDGLAFKARTAIIRSQGDELILGALQSSAFKDGLKLLGTIQPVLPQLVGLASGITQTLITKRLFNKQVQCFDLGLDFSNTRTSARLRRGSYVAVQVADASLWDWKDWRYDPSRMNIVDDQGGIAPVNAIIFSVSDSDAKKASSATREEGTIALKEMARSAKKNGA